MSLEDFKVFVKDYPKLKDEVREQKRTWQEIYDEWKILGDDGTWDKYKDSAKEVAENMRSQETITSLLNYVKKIDPATITNGLNTMQKMLSMYQAMNKGSSKSINSPQYGNNSIFQRDFKGFE